MPEKTAKLFNSKDIQILGKMLRYVFFVSAGFSIIVSIAIANIEFHLNRGGKYCDRYGDGILYFEKEDCYLDIMNILSIFTRSLIAYSIFSFGILVVISSMGFLLYLVRDRRHLGTDASVGGTS